MPLIEKFNMDGIININKPREMTSFDIVAIVRRACSTKRVGHLGTLDPMAEGVLPVTIGRAGRIMDYLDTDIKVYRGSARLGIETDTLDIWGKTLNTRPVEDVNMSKLEEAVTNFSGVITQTPPMYSALKVKGKKLYEYAREGKEVDVKSRKIFVERAEIISFDGSEFEFEIACSKGTYIRSICADIGKALGCGAAMSSLIRTRSGCFELSDSVDIEKLQVMTSEDIEALLLPIDMPLPHLGRAEVSDWEKHLFINGVELRKNQWLELEKPRFANEEFPLPIRKEFTQLYRVYDRAGDFLGTAIENKGLIKADKVFYNANI